MNYIPHALFLCVTTGAMVVSASAADGAQAKLPPLCPQPQKLTTVNGGRPLDVSRGASLHVLAGAADPVRLAAERLASELAALRGDKATEKPDAEIFIGLASDWRAPLNKTPAPGGLVAQAEQLPDEGYVLKIDHGKAWVIGRDIRGTVYGTETLIQLLRAGPVVPALEIRDFPDTPLRIAYSAGGNRLGDRIRQIVRLCVHYKLNMIVFENGSFYRLDDAEELAGVRAVFDHCEKMGIEPVPELQSFGWSQFVLPLAPECVESVRWEDRPMGFGEDDVLRPPQRPTAKLDIVDPGLEEAGANRFAGWQQDDVGETIFADKDNERGGYLRITRLTPGVSRAWQEVPCEPNTYYRLAADVKTEKNSNDFMAYFEVYGNKTVGTHGREFLQGPVVTSTTDWQRRGFKFFSNDSSQLRIYLRIQEGAGTACFDNVSCQTAEPTPMVNLVVTEDAPIVVKSVNGKVYKEGVDYEVEPGEIRYPYAENVKPWKITRRPQGGIKKQEQVLVSYDWAEEGDITYCPSDPRTHDIMRRSLDRTIRLLRPRYVHIGHDEPRVINRCSRCRKRGMEAHEIFIEEVARMHRFVNEADPEVRMMIWSDALRVRPDGKVQIAWFSEEKCTFADAVGPLPKDIIMCPWEYSATNPGEKYDEMKRFADAGFALTGANWYSYPNTVAWAEAVRRIRAESDKCLGIFLTTWSDRWEALPLTADFMWTLNSPACDLADPELESRLQKRYSVFKSVE